MEKRRFEEINLSVEIQKGISAMGFEEMSPIQSQAIPIVLEGKDIVGQAQTGTGKTASFGLPILEKVDASNKKVQALILCPTRELSIQVAEEISKLGKFKNGLKVLPVYGGQPIDRQINAMKKGVQIIVGTPGRVIDHIKRKTLKTDSINMIVLDEADEMFAMGFRDDMELVINQLPETRQTIFFSATMAPEIMKFAKKYQDNPEVIKVVHKELTVPKVEQGYFDLKEHMKIETLSRVLDVYNPQLTVVFCNTKRKVDDVTSKLQARGYFSDGLHGDLKQNQRDTVMNKFRNGTIDILVATDVAARGIDVDEVDLVINYDMPQDEEYYVHRIGRTARAGREGKAFSFVVGRDRFKLKDIMKYTKTNIPRKEVPTLKDIEDVYMNNSLDKIKNEINKGDLNIQENMIKNLMEEGYTEMQIAAALLRISLSDDKSTSHEELESVDVFNKSSKSSSERKPQGDRKKRDSKNHVRLFVNVGSKDGVKSRHLLAAFVQDGKVNKDYVGDIDIYDKFSFVEVDKSVANEVIENLGGNRIKGRMVSVERANKKTRK